MKLFFLMLSFCITTESYAVDRFFSFLQEYYFGKSSSQMQEEPKKLALSYGEQGLPDSWTVMGDKNPSGVRHGHHEATDFKALNQYAQWLGRIADDMFLYIS